MTTFRKNKLQSQVALLFLIFLATFSSLSCNSKSAKDKKYGELTEADYEHKIDTIDGEEVYFKTAVSASFPQDFANLNNSQKLFIKHNLQAADSVIRKHQPNSTIDNFTPPTLDSLIDLWNVDSTKLACTENYFVNTIGTAFGFYLVKTYKMKWTIVSDEYGTDYATTITELNLSNFPLNSVIKAIEQRRESSLQQISLITKKQIADLRNTK